MLYMLAWVTLFDRFPVQKALARAAAKAEKAAAALASAAGIGLSDSLY